MIIQLRQGPFERLPEQMIKCRRKGRIEMEFGVVVGIAAICVMGLIGVLAGVIAAVATVSGIDTRDNEGD